MILNLTYLQSYPPLSECLIRHPVTLCLECISLTVVSIVVKLNTPVEGMRRSVVRIFLNLSSLQSYSPLSKYSFCHPVTLCLECISLIVVSIAVKLNTPTEDMRRSAVRMILNLPSYRVVPLCQNVFSVILSCIVWNVSQ